MELKSKTFNIPIKCPADSVYLFISNVENFPKWAKTFCRSITKAGGDEWMIETAQGPVKAQFTRVNAFGILDHYLTPASGKEIFVPMRVVGQGERSVVIFTLFQQPGMSEEDFEKDQGKVEQDLNTLKHLMESEALCPPKTKSPIGFHIA